jgi:hypothetical protein
MEKNDVLLKEIANFFDPGDDGAWNDWVDFMYKPEWRDLYDLIASNVRPSIKKRAILILLVPFWKWVPFYWHESDKDYKYWCDREFIKTLTPELAEYTADLVKRCHEALINLNQLDNYCEIIRFYNLCIIDLLPLVHKEKAAVLFNHYKINLCECNDYYVYLHFINVLKSDVDIMWKRMADAQLRQIIISSELTTNKPETKNDRRRALWAFTEMFEIYIHCKKLPYNLDLFASQVDFIIDNTRNEKNHILRSDHLANYLKVLADEKYQKLRHKISRYIILHEKNHFVIYSEKMMDTARMAMDEFGKTDTELALKLEAIIAEGKALLAEKRKKAEVKRIKGEKIWANMR